MNQKSVKFNGSMVRSRQLSQVSSETGPNERSTTFDQQECVDFLNTNDYAVLIRGHSPCPGGFEIDFAERCLTVFSCSNHDKQNNEAAVVLIDGSDRAIRCIRYDTSCVHRWKSHCLSPIIAIRAWKSKSL